MAQKKNQNKQSGQLARQSQKNNMNQKARTNSQKTQQRADGVAVSYSKQALSSSPSISQSGKKCCRITHRELVSSVAGNTTFGVTSFSLNPGLASTFPWLSQVAANYEQYRFTSLKFHYVNRAPTSYVGSVLMAPEYDALDSAPTNEVNASMMDGAVEDAPWKDIIISFSAPNMFPMGPRKYIRTGATVTASDLKTYDAGTLFLCLVSCADTSTIGKLWVEYDVDLFIPQNPNAAQVSTIGSYAYLNLITNDQTFTSGVNTTVLFNSKDYDSIAGTLAAGILTVPAGNYRAIFRANFNNTNAESSTYSAELLLNGASLSPKVTWEYNNSGGIGANSDVFGMLEGPVVTTSSGTVSVKVTMSGAAGTLTLRKNDTSLSLLRVF